MQVGDIMTVKVKITDNAKIENGTARSRSSKEDSGVTDFIGSKLLTGQAAQLMPGKILATDSTASSEGKGSVNRQEALLTNVAAVVTQVLPNGNLQVSGEKQIGINEGSEFIRFSGVVNPSTITNGNTVSSAQVADARIEYRANGYIDEAQVMGWLARFFLTFLPF